MKIIEAEKEKALMRKIFDDQLKVVKEQDRWSTKSLTSRKNFLENQLQSISKDESDEEIEKVRREILVMERKIEESNVSIKELSKAIFSLNVWKRPCLKASRLTPKKVEAPKIIFGTDHMGSRFIKVL